LVHVYTLKKCIYGKRISRKKLVKNVFRLRSGSGSGRYQKWDPDPDKNRLDPHHGVGDVTRAASFSSLKSEPEPHQFETQAQYD
jgi:hypothetical protein